ncbi:hypothetical protein NQ176_g1452 [Zarea fungicola]|uniref:Uncharacterized protein n=2 Tax=Zarea fungicola TaxID=93591 RepID=A0ACC1MNM7_9HYPO|nr:hypothetical protein NQ176_g9280 [Lecanicillium fungicola]KAJ2982337.1 hypothetical protein NQ176_g1452 [Lecanicillium fungicola]
MKFIYIAAVLTPAVLAAKQDDPPGFGTILEQQCGDMDPQCLAIAKDLHQTDGGRPNIIKDVVGLGGCGPDFQKCIKKITAYLSNDPADADAPTKPPNIIDTVICMAQILPDHFKYTSHPATAKMPFPAGKGCTLRDLHRLAHYVLAKALGVENKQ